MDSLQIFDTFEQGTPEWFAVRRGIPTASCFDTVMASGRGGGESKTRKTYLLKLAGEIITGDPMANYSNDDMERGKEQEEEARRTYKFLYGGDLKPVAFIRRNWADGSAAGASPDCLVDDKGGLEIKSAAPHIQAERLLRGDLPPEHRHQLQGGLWLANRDWWDFASYCPKMPMFRVRVTRDEGFIAKLAGDVKDFNGELAEMVAKLRAMAPPAEAAA